MADRGDDARVDRLEAALKASRASRVEVRVGDEWRELAAARTRGRWRRLAELALRMDADGVRCLIGDRIVDSIALDEDDEQEAEQTATPNPGPPPTEGELVRFASLLRLVIEAQDRAVARHTEQARGITDAAIGVMRAATDRATTAERAASAMMAERARDLELAASTLDARAEEARDGATEAGLDSMMATLVQLHGAKKAAT